MAFLNHNNASIEDNDIRYQICKDIFCYKFKNRFERRVFVKRVDSSFEIMELAQNENEDFNEILNSIERVWQARFFS